MSTTTHPDHPDHLAKQILAHYLATWDPDSGGAVAGPDGRHVGLEIYRDDGEPECLPETAGPDLMIFTTAEPVEKSEGSGLWEIQLGISLTLPPDVQQEAADDLRRDIWAALTLRSAEAEPLGERHPLAVRLTAAGAAWAAEDGPGEGGPVWWCADVRKVMQDVPQLLESQGGTSGTVSLWGLTLTCGVDFTAP